MGWALLPAPIAGTVVDAAGRPVAAASVASSSPGARVTLRTDATGRYRGTGHLWQVDPGVVISAPGFRAQHADGGRTVLHRLPWFGGTVRDDAGNPVSGAVVKISQGVRRWRSTSDQEGRFAVTARGEGPASVSVTAPDHDGASRRVSLRPDLQLTLNPVLPRWLGTVDLASDPSGVALEVDGAPAPACPATPCRIPLMIGHHVVSAPDDFVPWSQAVDLARGQVVQVHPQLTRKTGTLSVNAPPGQLLMDGNQVAGGPWTAQVATGHHTLVFRSPATWPATAGVDVGWNQSSEVAIQPSPVVPGDTASFQAALKAYLGGIQGSSGVWIQELGSGRTLGLNQDAKLEAASVIKVPEALYLLHQVDAGAVKLTDQVSLQSDDFMSGTGILYGQAHPGDQISYQDLLTDLIRYSDNTAWLALRRVLGSTSIDGYAASLGAGDCGQQSDMCTAQEAGTLFLKLAGGSVLGPTSTQLLLGLLESTVYNDRINYYLPGVTIAHKVGMDGGVMNDCGIVYATGSPFVVCVFTDGPDSNSGIQAIRDISRAANHYFGH